jgi:hypothetical protein
MRDTPFSADHDASQTEDSHRLGQAYAVIKDAIFVFLMGFIDF